MITSDLCWLANNSPSYVWHHIIQTVICCVVLFVCNVQLYWLTISYQLIQLICLNFCVCVNIQSLRQFLRTFDVRLQRFSDARYIQTFKVFVFIVNDTLFTFYTTLLLFWTIQRFDTRTSLSICALFWIYLFLLFCDHLFLPVLPVRTKCLCR
jgi:hypothetical protein